MFRNFISRLFNALLVVIVTINVVLATSSNSTLSEPVLTFNQAENITWDLTLYPFDKNWKNVTKDGEIPTYFAKQHGSFTVICRASYPIHFIIEGYINPPYNAFILATRRFALNNNSNSSDALGDIFETKIFFTFFDPANSASAKVICQGIQHQDLKTSFKMFYQGKNRLVNSGRIITIQNTALLPCATTNPSSTVQLKLSKADPQTAKSLQYEKYDSTQGFQLPQPILGNFTCNSGNETVTIISLIKNAGDNHTGYGSQHKDFHFPLNDTRIGVINEPLEFHCGSAPSSHEPIDIWPGDKNAVLNYSINTDFEKKFTITPTRSVISSMECYKTNESINDSTIVLWKYTILEYPGLYVDNAVQEFNCLSDGYRTLTNIKCNNPSHCGFLKRCFEDPAWCNGSREGYAFLEENSNTTCSYRRDGDSNLYDSPCVKADMLYLSGMVQCTGRGVKRIWNYFSALNSIRYFDYRFVPEEHLLRMDEVKPILYTNHTQTFVCVGVAYLFADNVKFKIEYNGTDAKEEDVDESLYKYNNVNDTHPRKINWFNVIAEIRINLPLDAVAVHCYASWWNSTKYEKVVKRFQTRDLIPATILTPKNPKVTFIEGESNQRLSCPGKGEPAPNYDWFYYDDQGKQINIREKEEYKSYPGADGEGILDFLSVTKNMPKIYLCQATNLNGTSSFNFTVNVEDKVVATSNTIFWVVIGLTIFLTCVVLLITGFVMRRYLLTVQKLRELQEDEIDEFFAGNPDLMGRALTQENVNFWPYDKRFEVGLSDITYDASNMLGTGNYAYVVRGLLVSQDRQVAIKFPKTTTQTDEFKGMLTEIKIMIFIGKHDNIITFLGACTEFIKERKVHILLELAENGSLHSYLRNHKPKVKRLTTLPTSYENVMKENDDAIKEMDLVRWSYEIAQGMEYLAYKKIVHSDLASRNVLLDANLTAKISDFGLSRQLYGNLNYTKKTQAQLPWRWMAIESLTAMEFSSESDVWSYGVTIWEVFSFGDTPFANATWSNEFLDMLKSGIHLGKPRDATTEIYGKMAACWDVDKAFRPTFTTLRMEFAKFLQDLGATGINYENVPNPAICPETQDLDRVYENSTISPDYSDI